MINKIFIGATRLVSAMLGTDDVSLFLGSDRKYPLCEESTAYTASNITASTVEANATTNTVTWAYTCVVTHVDCTTTTTTGTSSSSVTFTQNTTNSQRTVSGNISWNGISIQYSFYQKGVASYTAPTANNRTYDTTSKELLNAGAVTGGTIQYSSNNSTWSTTIPSQTNAGTYTTYWRIVGDSTHSDKASASISTTVSAKTVSSPTITLSQTTYTYSNSACKPTPTVKDGSTTIASSEYTVSYSNNVNVGTATCTITDKSGGNYTVSGSKTFTINCYSATAPTAKNPNWTGSAQNLVNAGSTSYGTVVYSSDNSTFSTTIPQGTAAGSYTVYWKVSGNTNVCQTASTSISCSIKKVAMSYNSPAAKTGLSYTGSAQQIVSGGSATGGSIYYATSDAGANSATTVPSKTNAGSYTIYWKAVPDGNHSGGTSSWASISCSIAKVAMTYTAPKAAVRTYNGSAQQIVSGGSANGGSIQYCSTSGGTYSTTVPTQTNASTTYSTWWKAVPDGNHSGGTSAAQITGCTINKAAGSVTTAPTAKSLTFNNTNQALVNAGSGTGTMMYFAGYDINIYTEPDGSKWRRIAHQNNPTSYKFASNNTFSTGVYIDANRWFDVDYCGQLTSFELMIKQKATSSSTEEKYRWIQSYNPMTATFAQVAAANVTKITTAGYSTSSFGGLYPINSYTYLCANNGSQGNWWGAVGSWTAHQDGIPAWNGVVVTTGYVDLYVRVTDANISNSWSSTIPSETNAGTYVVAYKASASTNYNESTSGSVSVTINKVTPTVTAPTAKSLTYNGSAQALVNAGSTNYGALQYSSDNSNWGTSIPSGTNATSYTVYYRVVGNNNINDKSSVSVSCSIAKKTGCAISFATTSVSKTYGNAAFTNAITNSGDGSLTWGSSNTNIATVNSSGKVTIKAAGSCTISATTTSTTNCTYSTTAASYTLSIAKAAMTSCTPTAKSGLVYNGSAQVLMTDCTPTGGDIQYSGGSNSSYSTTVPTATNANSYTINWKNVPDSNHSGGTTGSATVTIAKAAMTYTAPSGATRTYTGSAQQIVSGGSANGGSIYYATSSAGTSSSTTVPTKTDASTGYNVYWKAVPNSNHSGGTSSWAKITGVINKASQSAPTATGATVTYHNTATATASGGGGHGTLTWTNGNTRTSTGTTTTAAYWAGDSNYNASPNSNSVNLVVNKATDQSITVTLTNRTYNTSSQVVATATAHGISNYYLGFGSSSTSAPTSWGSANSSISQTNAGTYYVWYKGTADGNHSADIGATYKGTVTIGKADQSAPTATGATTTYNTTATATASGGGGQGSLEWSNGNTQTSVGSKTTKARWSGNSNYNASPYSNEVTIKMNKAAGSISYATTSVSKTYGNAAFTNTLTKTGDGSVTYASSNTGVCTVNSSGQVTIKAVGSCTITATVTDGTNYTYATKTATYTITVNKASQSAPTATGATATYGNTATATASGGGGHGSIEWSNGSTRTAVGSQTTKARWSGNSNYNASDWSSAVTLTVTQWTDATVWKDALTWPS